jgi:hemerythrin-like domain-containing protein
MLVQIGQRAQHEDLVDLLAECHERIRRFLSLATALAGDRLTPESEARSTAGQIRRYFSSAFPHHVADEDDVIAPRLAGQNSKLDEVLAQVHGDHLHHADAIALLVGICTEIERDPQMLPIRASELRHAAALVTKFIEPHLEIEERELFPAVRALSHDDQAAIRTAMRQRREADFAK